MIFVVSSTLTLGCSAGACSLPRTAAATVICFGHSCWRCGGIKNTEGSEGERPLMAPPSRPASPSALIDERLLARTLTPLLIGRYATDVLVNGVDVLSVRRIRTRPRVGPWRV